DDRNAIAEADVVAASAGGRADLRFALAAIAAVERRDTVFDRESRQLRLERLVVEHVQREPPVGDVGRPYAGRRDRVSPRGPVDRPRLRTVHPEPRPPARPP